MAGLRVEAPAVSGAYRFQLSRRKGYRMPEGGRSIARPSLWGNHYRVVPLGGNRWQVNDGGGVCSTHGSKAEAVAEAVALHRVELEGIVAEAADGDEDAQGLVDWMREELAGRPLGCWCPLGSPCHVDAVLEVVNR